MVHVVEVMVKIVGEYFWGSGEFCCISGLGLLRLKEIRTRVVEPQDLCLRRRCDKIRSKTEFYK